MNRSKHLVLEFALEIIAASFRLVFWIIGSVFVIIFFLSLLPSSDQTAGETELSDLRPMEQEDFLRDFQGLSQDSVETRTPARTMSADEIFKNLSQATEEQLRNLYVEHWIHGDTQPQFVAADDAKRTLGSKQVIGFELDGAKYAFATSGMLRPFNSLVTFEQGKNKITVAYSCHFDQARVLVSESSEQLQVGLAGLSDVGNVLLTVDGKCFDLEEKSLPIPDINFTKTTLEKWCLIHPNTRLYLGGLVSS